MKDNKWDYGEAELLNHIICGDFNPSSRGEVFDTRVMGNGFWDLSDSKVPTFTFGNFRDRFILGAARQVFEAILPTDANPALEEEGGHRTEHFFPTREIPWRPLSYPTRVCLDMPFCAECTHSAERRLPINNLTTED